MTDMLGWQPMRDAADRRLSAATGRTIASWAAESREAGVDDEPSLRAWLAERGVHGYAQMFVVMERFGYPDYFESSPQQLVDAQYADRPALRPVLEAVLARAAELPGTAVQARKGYVSLVARRQFALVRPTTRTRVDLGLRLEGVDPQGRLLPARSLGNDTITVRVPLASEADVDDEVGGWLARAHEQSR